MSHKPSGRLPLLSARPAVTPATLKRAATSFAAWWTEAQWGWTVCLKLLPDSVAAAIWTRAFCAWVQHANHSSTEPPTLLYRHFALCIFPGNPAQLVWCRYDHLTRLLTKILDERPSNAVDVFEDFSRNVKEARFVSGADNLQDRPDASAESRLAETQLSLFTVLHCIALQQDYLLWPR